MVITTILLAVLARRTWGWSNARTVVVLGLFGLVDLAFFAANVPKIPTGGWLPLLIGAVLVTTMIVWRTGRARIEVAVGSRTPLPVERFIGSLAEHPQARVRGTAVYMARQPGMVPTALVANLRHNEVLHDTVILCHVATKNEPRVPRPRRVTFHDLGEGFSQVVVHVGFMETPDVASSLATVTSPDFGFDPSDAVYLLSRETIVGARRILDRCFAMLHRNSTTAAQFFGLPPEKVLEVGVQVPLERHHKVPVQW